MSTKGYVDWSKVEQRKTSNSEGSSAGDGRTVEYVKFAPGKYKFRLLNQAYFYDQHFIPRAATGADKDIPVISPGKDVDPLIPLGFEPSEKAAINVLDRKDGNKLKLMRVGPSVYSHFINYAQEAGVNPGDPKEGPDFIISVEDPGGNARQRKYTVTALKTAPLTKEEAKAIKDAGGLYDLEKFCKPTSVEEIEKIIAKYNITSNSGAGFDDAKSDSKSKSKDSSGSFDSDDEDEDEEEDDEDFGF